MLQKLEFKREANLIGGEWVGAEGGKTIDVTDPATGDVIGTVPGSGKAETKRAIEAAAAAFPGWAGKLASERADALRKLAALIEQNKEELAMLLTVEQGKSLTELRGEVGMSAAYVLWFAEEARRMYGDTIPSPWAGPPHHHDQAAGRCRRRDHAVELPVVDDRAQARAGAGDRLHDGHQAGLADALFRACLGRAVREGRHSRRRGQYPDRQGERDRRLSSPPTRW